MTDKLSGIKPGDRVRVTFEGEVKFCCNGIVNVKVDAGDPLPSSFDAADTQSPHFHIERIEKPLAVGDIVNHTGTAYDMGLGEILCIDGDRAFVRWSKSTFGTGAVWMYNLERLA